MTNQQRFNPLNDYLFYKIMGEKGDEVQLLGFINAVLHRTGENLFNYVEILENKTFTPEVIGDKTSILDVRAVLQDNTRANIEVQLRNQHNMERRGLFYWSREYVKGIKVGQGYHELPNVLAINIVNYEFLLTGKFHTCFHLREDEDRDIILTDALEIHFLDMIKYRRQAGKSNLEDDPLSRWMAWLNEKSPPELIAEVVKMDAAIQAANERMVYVTGDDEAIRAYEMREMAKYDWTTGVNTATEKGRAEEKLEIARNSLGEGLPIELIHKITGLDIETIKQLAK